MVKFEGGLGKGFSIKRRRKLSLRKIKIIVNYNKINYKNNNNKL